MFAGKTHDTVLVMLVIVAVALIVAVTAPAFLPPDEAKAAAYPTPKAPQPATALAHDVPSISEETVRRKGLSLREAEYYQRRDGRRVQCLLCPTYCLLADGQRGQCRARMNIGGRLRSLVYARVVAVQIDPVEKKPLNHFLPGSRTFSIATAGCNLGCIFCQNWSISQALPEEASFRELSPAEVVDLAAKYRCEGIAYTYTEPTAFFEYMRDCAKLARERGIRNQMITCGYINPEPLKELCKYLDAANVDLKGFSEEFYQTYCHASLQPVLETLKVMRAEGVWVEITNLVIPQANDDPVLIREMCKWIVANLGRDVPLHFSRFHPDYRLRDRPPTPTETLVRAKQIAEEEGIRYVFIGNVHVPGGADTRCPACGRTLIERIGFFVKSNHVKDGKCEFCGAAIPGVWK